MSRTLSKLLEAKEPDFHRLINRLELASGRSGQDIKLSLEVTGGVRRAMERLRLDPDDTTGEELYQALQAKMRSDDSLLIKRLRKLSATYVSAEGNITDGISYSLSLIAAKRQGFGVKNTVLKQLLIKLPPTRTMKLTSYRSVTSMLKHEPVQLVVAMAENLESLNWQKQYMQRLGKLSPRDCEDKKIAVFCPNVARWSKASRQLMATLSRSIIMSSEAQSLVVLPLKNNRSIRSGLTSVSLCFGLNGLNALSAAAGYLKLSQVTSDFGERLSKLTRSEPVVGPTFLNGPLSWETIQRYFHHISRELSHGLEDPLLDIERLGQWQPIEQLLKSVAGEMEFWSETGHLGSLHRYDPVSLNVVDNALNLANERNYAQRARHHGQKALWQELMARYLHPESLVDALSAELTQPQLAEETVEV
jgi:hypothetical protein